MNKESTALFITFTVDSLCAYIQALGGAKQAHIFNGNVPLSSEYNRCRCCGLLRNIRIKYIYKMQQ